MSMPSVGPETTLSKDESIHPPRDSHRQTPHSRRERAFIGRFDQQVQMIGLHREMYDSKHATVSPIRLRDGAFQRWKDELRSQRPKRRA
jgi:hypothetical protein